MRHRVAAALLFAGLTHAAPVAAQYGISEPWTADPSYPYAVWQAKSAATQGSTIMVSLDNAVVDKAPLFPQSLVTTDQDLVEGAKVWLPKGGLLVAMRGAGDNWYCTWRFDTNAHATAAVFAVKYDVESELCLKADATGHTSGTIYGQADAPAVLTVRFFGSRVRQNDIGPTNSVMLSAADPTLLPARADAEVLASHQSGKLCLRARVTPLLTEPSCFNAVGDQIAIYGGRYTLVAQDGKTSATLRIDVPLSAPEIGPETGRPN